MLLGQEKVVTQPGLAKQEGNRVCNVLTSQQNYLGLFDSIDLLQVSESKKRTFFVVGRLILLE